jgi:hypothetical protein
MHYKQAGFAVKAELLHTNCNQLLCSPAAVDCCVQQLQSTAVPQTVVTLGKMTTWFTPSERASATWSTTFLPYARRLMPGMEAMGSLLFPSCTKMGRMK